MPDDGEAGLRVAAQVVELVTCGGGLEVDGIDAVVGVAERDAVGLPGAALAAVGREQANLDKVLADASNEDFVAAEKRLVETEFSRKNRFSERQDPVCAGGQAEA